MLPCYHDDENHIDAIVMNTNKNNMAQSIRTFSGKRCKNPGKFKQRQRPRTLIWIGKVFEKRT